MYTLLLCWRYLRTRYIALASIISVTLGVATMIVVNAVMAGFTHEMQNRIHGILSDVVFESRSFDGFPDPDATMDHIHAVAGEWIESMSTTVTVPAMLNFDVAGQSVTRPVQLIGIDARTQSSVSDFGKYLQHPANRRQMSFELRDGGYDVIDHQAEADAVPREALLDSGWPHRRRKAAFVRLQQEHLAADELRNSRSASPPRLDSEPAHNGQEQASHPWAAETPEAAEFDPAQEQHTGIVLGIALVTSRDHDGKEYFLAVPGDDVRLTLPTAGSPPKGVSDTLTIVDFYESKMSEYDASFVFVPIQWLQNIRGMYDRETGTRYVSSIQIKLKQGADGGHVRDELRAAFPSSRFGISTWQDKQGPLLAAVNMETAILNVLLFLIIAVAGFGILAIFYMIVVEKTKDIGVLKSLGASARGVLATFLGYGLSLGCAGAGAGMVLGLMFVAWINEIAKLLGQVTGHEVFDPSIYYFYRIPTIVEPFTVGWIVLGAVAIAVLASILPARCAARLHPVEALRYE